MDGGRGVLMLAAVFLVTLDGAPVAAASSCVGRYVVRSGAGPLLAGGSAGDVDVVELSATGVRLRSGCSLSPVTVRAMKKGGWRLRAVFAPCRSFGRTRLRVTLSADCARLGGRLTAHRPRMRKDFTATPSVCGDGVVDVDGGERCEPPSTASCDARCMPEIPLPPGCGNGVLDPGEQCDDAIDPAGCSRCLRTCAGQETFPAIKNRIFAPTCAVTGCHGPFPQANLDLTPDAALRNLIGVLADNPVARAAGKRRVVPGDAAASFLSAKLHGGALAAGEGVRMPDQGLPLSQTELDAIDSWIAAGAPSAGAVGGAPCLEDQTYVPAAPLPVPPGGYQLVLDGPTLQPGEEQEGCLWVPVPSPTDLYVSRFEFSLNPGTHHFSIFEYQGAGAPQTGVWQVNNFGCFNGANFGGSISGSPQAPYYVAGNPPGVARVLRAGHYLGLNAHYHNGFAVPIQMKVWTNIYPYAGTPEHIAQTLIDLGSTFSIYVPPFTQQTHRGRFTNTTAGPVSLIGLSGHMHFRGLRFTAWQSNGTKVYETYDWSHPGGVGFDPAFVLAPGDWFDYECLYDNGVEKPVRRDAAGNPTALTFGVTTEDAMCILTGAYYTG